MRIQIPSSVKTYGVIVIIIVASFWFASKFVEPPPPNKMILAAGSANGDYYRYALLYKEAVKAEGIELEVLETAGSQENIDLLLAGKADVAFIQSGLSTSENGEKIESLGSLYYEPLWVFSRERSLNNKDLQNLRGSTIAIGAKGSGTNTIVRQLLDLNKILTEATLVDLTGDSAVEALIKGDVDAAFFVARAESLHVQKLLQEEGIKLVSFQRAKGYARKMPFLSNVHLYEGAIDMAANIPQHDVYLLSPVAQLTSRTEFSGALKTLLISTAMSLHGHADMFSTSGQFPTLDFIDFPIAEEADRYYKYGPNLLQRVLPFWLADMVSRMVVMLIPFLGIMWPLMKIASPTYRWQTRAKIYRWYKSLEKMEAKAVADSSELQDILDALDRIDLDVKKTRVPLSYSDELYNLRLHIRMIKEHLQKQT